MSKGLNVRSAVNVNVIPIAPSNRYYVWGYEVA